MKMPYVLLMNSHEFQMLIKNHESSSKYNVKFCALHTIKPEVVLHFRTENDFWIKDPSFATSIMTTEKNHFLWANSLVETYDG